jgi:lysophospholipid acyltransferase (LPLAT)-like uncharacterized protein
MKRWGASALGRVSAASLRLIGRHATLHVTSADRELESDQTCRPFAGKLLHDAAQGHVIVPFWSAHQLTIALLALEQFGLRSALARFEVVADESFAGEIMCVMGERLGLTMRRIHIRGNAKRLEDVGAWMRDPKPFFIAVDGGSSYGTVPTGIVRMASRLRSRIWPMAIRARPCARVPGLIADFPLPGAEVALGVANPLVIDRAMPVAGTARLLKHCIDTATAAADALLGRSPGLEPEGVWMRVGRAS